MNEPNPPIAYDGRARKPLSRVNHEDAGGFYRAIARLLGGLLRVFTRQQWGPPALPQTGGVIVCPNHIANFDPFAVAHFVWWSGRFPRFLAKVEIFRIPIVGWVARACGQIPVLRNTEQAKDALDAARASLAAGNCVVLYPEGTRSRDPELWPMTGRPGAARLALTTRTPVIPLGNWGPQQVTPHRSSKWPRLFPIKTMRVEAGEPVDLADLYSDSPNHAAVIEATRRIMDAIEVQVERLRGEPAPDGRWDARTGARVPDAATGPVR